MSKIWYIDNSCANNGDGTQWGNAASSGAPGAWNSMYSMTGVSAGDTVYISGGPSGMTQTYNLTHELNNVSGWTDGVTYQIGQDALHNGTIIFNNTTGTFLYGLFYYEGTGFTLSGDAGDGKMHITVSNMNTLGQFFTPCNNVTLTYINAGPIIQFCKFATAGTNIHISHCYGYCNATIGVGDGSGKFCNFVVSGPSYGSNSVTYCEFHVPYQTYTAGVGMCGIQVDGNGITIAYNTLIGYPLLDANASNHHDAIQTLGSGNPSSQILIFNNNMQDWGNYTVFLDAIYGVWQDTHVYDNLIWVTNPNINTGSPGGIIMATQFGPSGFLYMTGVTITNNTIVDIFTSNNTACASYLVQDWFPLSGFYVTGCSLANNLFVNANGPGMSYNENAIYGDIVTGGIVYSNNFVLPASLATGSFVSYATYAGSGNNMNVTAMATGVTGQGIYSLLFGTGDWNGKIWLNPPSVGAFEWASGVLPPVILQMLKRLGAHPKMIGLSF